MLGWSLKCLFISFFVVWYTFKRSGTCSATKHLEHSYLVSLFFFLALHTTVTARILLFGIGGNELNKVGPKLYCKPVCFCGYFGPQWVADHELKNFEGVWFRRKIPDYGRFYPRISCKMKFWCLSPVTIHFQPSSFVFLVRVAQYNQLLASEFSTALSSLSLWLSELLSLSEKNLVTSFTSTFF